MILSPKDVMVIATIRNEFFEETADDLLDEIIVL